VLQTLLGEGGCPGQLGAALATFMNENIKTTKLNTLNLLTNFITLSFNFKKQLYAYYTKQLKEIRYLVHFRDAKNNIKKIDESWG
jgi:hypothetical protein